MADTDTGVRIRGFELMWAISRHSGPFCYLRTPGEFPHSAEVRAWREADGVARAEIDSGPRAYPHPPLHNLGKLTQEEAELVIEARERITAERFPAVAPEPAASKVEVPAFAEIAAAAEAEGTPLAFDSMLSRANRVCDECGSLVYGSQCTHCHES